MSADSAPPPPEYRRYRRFVSAFILSFVSLGSAWLLTSVGVTIYRRRNAVPAGDLVGAVATATDLLGCHDELKDVEQGLERHLDNVPNLVAHYDTDSVQRWTEGEQFWLGQWKAADERCHFSEHRPGKYSKEWEQLSTIYAELRETENSYTKELFKFGRNEAPRLDSITERLNRVGAKLSQSGPDVAGEPAKTKDSNATGDTTP